MNEIKPEDRLWAAVAWIFSIVGAILVLLIHRSSYTRHWAYLSISLFILALLAWMVLGVMSIIPFMALLSIVLSLILFVSVFIVWIIGIIKVISDNYWQPPVIYDLAKKLTS